MRRSTPRRRMPRRAPRAAADHKPRSTRCRRASPRWSRPRRAPTSESRAQPSARRRQRRAARVRRRWRCARAVERGEPFAAGARRRQAAGDGCRAASAPLEPFAATGVPRTAALARELSQLAAAMLNAAGTAPRDGGIIDRLQAERRAAGAHPPDQRGAGRRSRDRGGARRGQGRAGRYRRRARRTARLPRCGARARARLDAEGAKRTIAALAAARRLADNRGRRARKAGP